MVAAFNIHPTTQHLQTRKRHTPTTRATRDAHKQSKEANTSFKVQPCAGLENLQTTAWPWHAMVWNRGKRATHCALRLSIVDGAMSAQMPKSSDTQTKNATSCEQSAASSNEDRGMHAPLAHCTQTLQPPPPQGRKRSIKQARNACARKTLTTTPRHLPRC